MIAENFLALVHELPRARALDVAGRHGLAAGRYAFVTLHRPSNVDTAERLGQLVALLEETAERFPVVFPVHPRTRERLSRFGLESRAAEHPRIKLLDPLGYRETVGLMSGAAFALTDSGGIQEETTYLGVPCLTLRPNTERPATVTFGTNTIVGDDLARARALIGDIADGRYKRGGPVDGWDGRASERVTRALVEAWG